MGANSLNPKLPGIDPTKLFEGLLVIVKPLREIFRGLMSDTIPWSACFAFGSLCGVGLIFGVDGMLAAKLHLGWLYPASPVPRLVYEACVLFSGFYVWGLYRTHANIRLGRELTKIFVDSGLTSARGTLPDVVHDIAVDKTSRRLVLTKDGHTLEHFQKASGQIGSGLGAYIDEITEDRERGTVEIKYSYQRLSSDVKMPEFAEFRRGMFFVGETRGGRVTTTLEEVPHFLIAGQTRGGKSTFLRQLITTLYVNNDRMRMVLCDLKGGLEFQIFEGLERVKIVTEIEDASRLLEGAVASLERRMTLLKSAQCKDVEEFYQKDAAGTLDSELRRQARELDRLLIVVDEAYDLFRVGGQGRTEDVQRARMCANTIAQKGRACGVHIVIATQRPDRDAVDPQTKANLPGKICFQMANNASSMTVLDSGRAANLPKIPGRAVWQEGLDEVEVQTPNFTKAEAEEVLAKFSKEKKAKKSSQTANKEPSVEAKPNADMLEHVIAAASQDGIEGQL